jgi:hypothetical protein
METKDGHLIGYVQNSQDGFLCKGDSGGGIIYFVQSKPKLVAVTSSAFVLNSEGKNQVSTCEDISKQVEFVSSVKPHKAWLISTIKKYEEWE